MAITQLVFNLFQIYKILQMAIRIVFCDGINFNIIVNFRFAIRVENIQIALCLLLSFVIVFYENSGKAMKFRFPKHFWERKFVENFESYYVKLSKS